MRLSIHSQAGKFGKPAPEVYSIYSNIPTGIQAGMASYSSIGGQVHTKFLSP